MNILYFIVVLFVIVVVHEWGHYITAKFFGARVDEFGFGYPPKIATLFKKGETTFTLNALPFGGFVKIFGEDNAEDGVDTSRALFKKPKWQQAIVLVAGVVMNIVLAWVIFLVLFLSNSSVTSSLVDPKYVTNEKVLIVDVKKDSSAETGGLKKGDQIISGKTYDNQDLTEVTPSGFVSFLQKTKGQSFILKVNRGGEEVQIALVPKQTSKDAPFTIGVGVNSVGEVKVPFFKRVLYSFTAVGNILGSIFGGLFDLVKSLFGIHSNTSIEVSGPIGIVKSVGDAAKYGFSHVLIFTALISLNLAALNILPIPALDGGRLLFLLIEKIKGKPLNTKTSTTIHAVSFFILVGLMLLVTVFDVFKLFTR